MSRLLAVSAGLQRGTPVIPPTPCLASSHDGQVEVPDPPDGAAQDPLIPSRNGARSKLHQDHGAQVLDRIAPEQDILVPALVAWRLRR